MHQRPRKRRAAVLAVGLCLSGQAASACDGAEALSGLLSDYTALVSQSQTPEARRIARNVLEAPGVPAAQRTAPVRSALDGVRGLARKVEAGAIGSGLQAAEIAIHMENIGALAAVVSGNANCDDPGRTAFAARTSPTSAAPDTAAGGAFRQLAGTGARGLLSVLWPVATALAVLLALGTAAIRLYTRARRRAFERFPHGGTVAIRSGGDTTALPIWRTVVDISRGGLKLAWPGGAPIGTQVLVDMPAGRVNGTVNWSNPHYTGVQFDTLLSAEDIQTALGAAASSPPPETKTAPEAGAV